MMKKYCKQNRRRYRVEYLKKPLNDRAKKVFKIAGFVFLALFIICLILIFVVFPIIFMNTIGLQRMIMFTTLGLPQEREYFQRYEYVIPGLRNMIVTVRDDINKTKSVSLGLWHLLPHNVTYTAILERDFDFDGYGDSSNAVLTEEGVVSDSIQLYEWLSNRTTAPIFIWGHSLGSALATRTLSYLTNKHPKPIGLVLEGAFTSMREELPVHPYGKLFAWLPWFEATVLNPLERNGFIFNTSKYIRNVDIPIMILSAEDDATVPYYFGRKLFDIVSTKLESLANYYQFLGLLGYNHFWIYEEPLLPSFLENFIQLCSEYSDASS